MQSASLVVLLLLAAYAHAHMFLSSVYINNQKNTCVRPHPTSQYDYPISDKVSKRFSTTTDMICGWPPALTTAAPNKCAIAAGTSIQLQWWHANEGDDVVDGSHHGPCLVYMAKSDSGQGQVWFKIYEEGYNAATGEWCTDRIRKDGPNKGRVDVKIPTDLSAGNYLLRSEFWALHEGYTEYGAQPYVGCLELTISGSGAASPALTNIVGLYQPTDPGLLFNIYNQQATTYTIPGPAVYVSGSLPASSTTQAPSSGSTTTSAPSSSPTSTPSTGSTNPPTTNDTNCAIGFLGCPCSGGKYCNAGLGCTNDLCLPQECDVGSEKCTCTKGGACDTGLTCLSNLCVNADPLVSAIKSSAVSLTASFLFLVLLIVSFAL